MFESFLYCVYARLIAVVLKPLAVLEMNLSLILNRPLICYSAYSGDAISL